MKRAGVPVQQVVSAEQFRQMIGLPSQSHGRAPHVPGKMNKTEIRYAQELEIRKRSGEIAWYGFELLTLKLAKATRYTPDFTVITKPGLPMECHEVKGGFFRDDAKVKLKVAAELFPFKFILCQFYRKIGWIKTEL